jgi:phage replication O-like protein O
LANPQKENGHVDIANEIMDALARTRVPGEARQVLDFIIRKTYGWQKKKDAISLTQFETGTGLSKVHICRAFVTLKGMNMIVITQQGNEPAKVYEIQKDYEKWNLLPKRVSVTQKGQAHYPKGSKPLPIRGTTINTSTKDTITITKILCPDSLRLSGLMANLILQHTPDYRELKNGTKEKTIERWAKDIDLMIRIDQRKADDIEKIIIFAHTDSFWFKNVLSGATLRKQFDKLGMNIKQSGRKKNEKHSGIDAWLQETYYDRQGQT